VSCCDRRGTFEDWVATLDADSLQSNSGWQTAKFTAEEPDQDAVKIR
jgi:hypothetical protein